MTVNLNLHYECVQKSKVCVSENFSLRVKLEIIEIKQRNALVLPQKV